MRPFQGRIVDPIRARREHRQDLRKDTWVKAVTAKIECQNRWHEAASKTSNLLPALNHEHGSGIRLETERRTAK
jgi:hypothetical protein